MLSLDATTRAAYDAQTAANARALAVLNGLTAPVSVRVYDGTGAVKGSGTMAAPWATVAGGVLTVGEVASFAVTSSGTPDASWYLRFEGGAAWLRGSFGLAGAGTDFTWSLPQWEAGQAGSLGSVAAVAYDVPVLFGWTFPQSGSESYVLPSVQAGGTTSLAALYRTTPGAVPKFTKVGGAAQPGITVNQATGEISVTLATPGSAGYQFGIDLVDDSASTINQAPYWIPATPSSLGQFALGAGGTFGLAAYAADVNGDPIKFSRTGDPVNDTAPASVTVDLVSGTVTVPADLPSGTYAIEVDAVDVVVSAITTLTVDVPGSSAAAAWTAGQMFKQGDVPTGARIVGSVPLQADVMNRWPDGSVKFAILSGVSSAGAVTVSKTTSAAPAVTPVAAITAADVGSTSLDLGVTFGSVSLAASINGANLTAFTGTSGVRPATAGRLRDWIVGEVMRESHYYSPVPGDPYLGVFWHVRKYANGSVEIETLVENGWVNVSAPAEKTYTATLTVNGTGRAFYDASASASVTQYHNTRWSRCDWVNAATPDPIVLHDVAYLKATKIVPNFTYFGAWSELTFTTKAANGNYSSYLALNDITAGREKRPLPLGPAILRTYGYQSGGGEDYNDQVGIVTYPDAVYLRTGDARALRAVEFNGRAGARHAVNYRSELTLGMPTPDGSTIYRVEAGTSTGNTPMPSGTFAEIEDEHQPNLGFFAYLCTGRYAFLELNQFEALYNFFRQGTGTPWPYGTGSGRYGSRGLMRSLTTRAIAWQIRTLAAAACITPDADPLAANLRTMFGDNVQWMWDIQTGPWAGGGVGTNDLGVYWTTNSATFTENYPFTSIPIKDPLQPTETFARIGPWQNGYMTSVFAWSWDMEITPTSKRSTHELVRNHGYKFVIGHLGVSHDGSGYSWRRMDTYYEPVGYPGPVISGAQTVASWFPSWRAMYEHFITYCGAADLDDSQPASQPLFDAPQGNGGFGKVGSGSANPTGEDYWAAGDRDNAAFHTATRSILIPLAYAVDHGYPEAAAKWALLMSTSDYADAEAVDSLSRYPRFVAIPR